MNSQQVFCLLTEVLKGIVGIRLPSIFSCGKENPKCNTKLIDREDSGAYWKSKLLKYRLYNFSLKRGCCSLLK